MRRTPFRSGQRGLGMVAAIVVLVILAALAGAIVALGAGQQSSSAQDMAAARAWQAARAGNEWGLFMALNDVDWAGPNTQCSTGARNQALNLTANTGFNVLVCCVASAYNEGESSPGVVRTVRLYTITAVACNAAACGGCGGVDAAAGGAPNYVERTRVVLAGDTGS
ncbi:MAG: MSHA biogenesis protein MshP [Rhodocyclaceae bacterium]|nr:MSHA biogenesis protein MshP [Rhodocyclaceae bacterium]